MTESANKKSNNDKIMRMEKGDNSSKRTGLRQATLRWPTEDRGEKRDSKKEREQREEIQKEQSKDEATWGRGGKMTTRDTGTS